MLLYIGLFILGLLLWWLFMKLFTGVFKSNVISAIGGMILSVYVVNSINSVLFDRSEKSNLNQQESLAEFDQLDLNRLEPTAAGEFKKHQCGSEDLECLVDEYQKYSDAFIPNKR